MTALLETTGLTKHFGGIPAVDGVDLVLDEGGIHALIGPNGAGKSTLVGLLCGRIAPDAGSLTFRGRKITGLSAPARVDLGIAYTFQITSIYPRLSVFDNAALAVQHRLHRTGTPRNRLAAETRAVLDRVGLGSREGERAGEQSYGHQRLIEIAMGLALEPRLLILDEPTQGLAAGEIDSFKALVRDVAETATVLLIEHNMDVVMDLAGCITVLQSGRMLATGPRETVRADPAVQAAYLGA